MTNSVLEHWDKKSSLEQILIGTTTVLALLSLGLIIGISCMGASKNNLSDDYDQCQINYHTCQESLLQCNMTTTTPASPWRPGGGGGGGGGDGDGSSTHKRRYTLKPGGGGDKEDSTMNEYSSTKQTTTPTVTSLPPVTTKPTTTKPPKSTKRSFTLPDKRPSLHFRPDKTSTTQESVDSTDDPGV